MRRTDRLPSIFRRNKKEEIDNMWKKPSEKIEEEVLEKYQVEVNTRGAIQRKRLTSEWRMVQGVKTDQLRKWFEVCFGESLLAVQGIRSAAQAKFAGEPNGIGRGEAAAKDKDHDRCHKENEIKRQSGREQQLVGQ